MRLLIAEDHPDIGAGLQDLLEIHGHQAVLARSGPATVAAAADGDFDILLADLELPGLDGLEVVRRIRARRPGLPVVILTGREIVDTCGLPPGPTEVLNKPQRPEAIVAAVDRVVRGG